MNSNAQKKIAFKVPAYFKIINGIKANLPVFRING